MSLQTIGTLALVSMLCVFGVSCDKPSPEKSAPAPTSASATTPNTHAAPTGSSEKTVAASAAPSASAAPEKPIDTALVGVWEASYDAKKGQVEMPPRVQDKVRSKDDGKMAIGKGTVEVTINADNEIDGSTQGALGAAKLHGKIEGDDVRATFFPIDATAKDSMFGILSGKRKEDRIEARIRVASGDATVVREAEIVLRKKP